MKTENMKESNMSHGKKVNEWEMKREKIRKQTIRKTERVLGWIDLVLIKILNKQCLGRRLQRRTQAAVRCRDN